MQREDTQRLAGNNVFFRLFLRIIIMMVVLQYGCIRQVFFLLPQPNLDTGIDPTEVEETQGETHPLSEGLVTLSNLPKSRWQYLQQLDVIKQHNKPKEPPKQPKQAPFFLPTAPGLQPKFTAATDDEIPVLEGAGSKILNLGKLVPLSEFQRILLHSDNAGDCK